MNRKTSEQKSSEAGFREAACYPDSGLDDQPMRWSDWWTQLKSIFDETGFEVPAGDSSEAWFEFYREGYTPIEAFGEDLLNG